MSKTDLIRTIQHTTSGASVKVSDYGATVISYKSKKEEYEEHIFVSKLALLDGTAPVRGGIPLVFPIFGPTTIVGSTMPQHGFARRNIWTMIHEYNNETSAGITYQLHLSQTSAGRGDNNIWSLVSNENKNVYDCTLLYNVDFNNHSMTTKLTIQNTGINAFPFQCLLHTYYKIHNHSAMNTNQCYVQGLDGYLCDDKVSKVPIYEHGTEPISISGEVDRVYTPPTTGGNKDMVHVTIGVGNDKVLTMEASGKVDNVVVPISCVVWNPYIEKAAGLADFDNDEYHDMLCIEPGILGNDIVLQPGKEAYLQQVMKV